MQMYCKHPHENWFQKGLRVADQGLKIARTMKGIYEIRVAVASGARMAASGARMAAPMLALL